MSRSSKTRKRTSKELADERLRHLEARRERESFGLGPLFFVRNWQRNLEKLWRTKRSCVILMTARVLAHAR
jgi:hypothetical protein